MKFPIPKNLKCNNGAVMVGVSHDVFMQLQHNRLDTIIRLAQNIDEPIVIANNPKQNIYAHPEQKLHSQTERTIRDSKLIFSHLFEVAKEENDSDVLIEIHGSNNKQNNNKLVCLRGLGDDIIRVPRWRAELIIASNSAYSYTAKKVYKRTNK